MPDFPTSRTNQLSVSAWVYAWRHDSPRWRCIATDYGNSSTPELRQWQFLWRLCEPNGDLAIWVRQRSGWETIAREGDAHPLPTYRWQHVAFVADGSNLRLYRNGREVAASPMAGLFIAPPKRLLTIGCLDNRSVDAPNMEPANFWRGNLDELAIFHRALSTHEIRELFKGQRLEKTTSIPSGKEMP